MISTKPTPTTGELERIDFIIDYSRGRTQGWGFIEDDSIALFESELRKNITELLSQAHKEARERAIEEAILAVGTKHLVIQSSKKEDAYQRGYNHGFETGFEED